MKSVLFPELRVKIKSLAAEARIIRAEAALHPRSSSEWQSLNHHRRETVAIEQRAALVALAFVRGVPYAAIERNPRCNRRPFDRPGPAWDRVAKIASRYGRTYLAEKPLWAAIVAWRSGGASEPAAEAVVPSTPAPEAKPGIGGMLRRAARLAVGGRVAAH